MICKFSFEINIDKETKEDLENYKNNLDNNNYETPTDDGHHKIKKYYKHFIVPSFINEEICILEPLTSKDIFLILLWFIVLITGYLDLLEIFVYYRVEIVDIKITKLVSNTNKYRVNYNLNDNQFDEEHNLPNKNEIYQTKELKELTKYTDTKEIELIN